MKIDEFYKFYLNILFYLYKLEGWQTTNCGPISGNKQKYFAKHKTTKFIFTKCYKYVFLTNFLDFFFHICPVTYKNSISLV